MGHCVRGFIVLLIFLGCVRPSHGQYYIWGQDPASLRWSQILTPNFRLLFPSDYEEQAAYIADVLEYTYDHGGKTLGHSPRRVPVILHNHTVLPNGFVSWAPARLEMFTTPPQSLDGHDWIEGLAVHEFRHVLQIDKFNQRLTRVLTYLLGQQATGIVLGLYVPLWFLEGDAVAAETGLTHGGRGRLPRFEQGLRAQVLQEGIYSFEKATLGSLRDHVPNHYELGYQLVADVRAQYGEQVWDEVLNHVARRPHTIVPFSRSLRDQTGMGKVELYNHTMQRLDSIWRRQKSMTTYTAASHIDHKKRLYTQYQYPVFLNDSSLLVLKNAMDDIPRVVKLWLDGREEMLFTPGQLNAHPLTTNGRLVVWSEYRRDPRWHHRSWSEIHVYDITTGSKRRLTTRTRYFSPAVSPDGTQIAVAEATKGNDYSIVVIDAESGEPLIRYDSPSNDFLMTPSWHADNQTIVAVALSEEGKRIVVSDEQQGGFITVFDAGRTEISRPQFAGPDAIIFNGAFSGVDKIYMVDMADGHVKQVVSSPFGAVNGSLSPDGGLMAWSDYSSMGYGIATKEFFSGSRLPLEQVTDYSHALHEVLAKQEGAVVTRNRIPRKEYLSLPYHKLPGLFNFHSWGPFAVDVDNMTGNPGFSVLSQNLLSTSVASVGYEYDLVEQRGRTFADIRYMGLYPVLNLRAERGLRESFYRDNQGDIQPFLWREGSLRAGASVPLSFQRGAWFLGLQPSVHAAVTRVQRTSESPSFFRRNNITGLAYRLVAFQQYRMVARDLRPRLGMSVDLNYRHTPFSGGDMGSIASARAAVLLPGLLRHNSLRLTASWQQRERGTEKPQTINYSYGNMVFYPRGISGRTDDQALVLTADYALPLAYPDWRIGPLLYIKRFSANVFYDYAEVSFTLTENDNSYQVTESLHSYGIDLLSRLHPLRVFADFDLGIRVMFPSTHQSPRFQFLWSVSI